MAMRGLWIVPAAVIAAMSFLVWASDKITWEGERTIYTVRCELGTWVGDRCSGRLVAAERFRFGAIKNHGEVLFRNVGSHEPSGKFNECVIEDGRNWSCKANAESPKSITLEMSKGRPVPDSTGATRPFHAVPKLSWMILEFRIPFGDALTSNAQ